MTTTSVIITVSNNWSLCDKAEKDGCIARPVSNVAAEAARELRETPATREQGLRHLREWIHKNNDIKNVRQDEEFLLRFLRQKKFSIPMAQQTLLKYLSLRSYYPEIFKNLDCEDPKLRDILTSGYIAVSPVRDNKGRRVILYNMSNFDATKYNCWDMCRAHVLVYESLLDDPMDQLCGFTHVGDGTGVTGAHITSWNPVDFARLMKWGEQSLPMRHKEFHLMNIRVTIKYIIDFAISRLTPKMADRLNITSSPKQLNKKVDAACLPKEYGGDLQFEDMISYTQQLLKEKREAVLDLEKMEIFSTKGIVTSKNSNALKPESVSVEGSFRKLDID